MVKITKVLKKPAGYFVNEQREHFVNFPQDGNNKKLQFEASPRPVHKQSTWQYMPIWEHKRTSSVILSEAKYFFVIRFFLNLLFLKINKGRI